LNELLPKVSLGGRLDGPRWIEVGFLNKERPARVEPARKLAHNRAAFGKMVQKCTHHDEVIGRIGWFIVHDVELADFQIAACNALHQIGTDVAGNDVSGGADALCEPP
jgi:hypothetical protein